MIVVTGRLLVDPAERKRYLELSRGAIPQARAAAGCLDFAVSADQLDPARVNVAERWASREDLERFRGDGPGDDLASLITSADVEEFEVVEHGEEATDELRDLVEARVEAVAAKDVDALAASLADEVESFNVLPPLRVRGREAVLAQTRAWFDGYRSEIGYEVHDLLVSADGATGFCSFTYHVSGTLVSGDDVDMWVRATLGCRRSDGRWLVTHDHESVPFDPETGRAVLAADR